MADRTTQYDSPFDKEEALHAEEVAQEVAARDAVQAETRTDEIATIEATNAVDEGRATPEQQLLVDKLGGAGAPGTQTPMTTSDGRTVQLNPVQAAEVRNSAGDERFNAMMKYDIIPQGSIYINEQSYIPASQVAQIQQSNPELGKILVTQGYEAYQKRLEADRMAYAEQIAAFEASLKNAPAELQDVYARGGVAGYNSYLQDNYVVLADGSLVSKADDQRIRDELSKITDAPNLLDAYDRYGLKGYNTELINYQENIAPSVSSQVDALSRQRQIDTALQALAPYSSVNDKGQTVYDVNKFVTENPTVEAVGTLSALNFDYKTVKSATDYVNNTDVVIGKLGEDPNKYSFGALTVQADALGLLTEDRPGVMMVKRNPEIIYPKEFVNSLTDAEKKALIGAMANDPNNKNAFASTMEQYNFNYSKLPITDQIITPFIPNIGMPLVAVQMVGTTIAKATTGQPISKMEIATDAAATALAILAHTSGFIKGTPEAPVKVLGIPGGAIVKSAEIGAMGIFGTNIGMNWNDMTNSDKVINSVMMIIPAIGLAKDLNHFVTSKATSGNDVVGISRQQAKVLDQITQTNKDFISREVISDPQAATQAEQAYNVMRAGVEDYSKLSLELKQAQKSIGDIGIAKNKAELDLLVQLRDKVSPLSDSEMRDLLKLAANDKTPTAELRNLLGLGDSSSDLSSQVATSRDAAERAISNYTDILGKNINIDDPAVKQAIDDVSKDALRDLDNITSHIVSPRTATEIAKDVSDINSQISQVEANNKELGITSDQINDYKNSIKDLNSQLVDLNREARYRYLSTGERVKTTAGGDIIAETKSLQQRLIDANNALAKITSKSKPVDVMTAKINQAIAERDIFEAVQKVTEPMAGRESYGEVLSRLNDNLLSLIETAKGDIKIQERMTGLSFDIYDAIRKGDTLSLNEGIRLLQIEASKLPKPLQLGAGEQIKQLDTFANNILRETLAGKTSSMGKTSFIIELNSYLTSNNSLKTSPDEMRQIVDLLGKVNQNKHIGTPIEKLVSQADIDSKAFGIKGQLSGGYKLHIIGASSDDVAEILSRTFSYLKDNDIRFKVATEDRFSLLRSNDPKILEQGQKAMTIYLPEGLDIKAVSSDIAKLMSGYKPSGNVRPFIYDENVSNVVGMRYELDAKGKYAPAGSQPAIPDWAKKYTKQQTIVSETKFAGSDVAASRGNIIRQQAERIVEQRWEKLIDRIPSAIQKLSPEQIKDYLRERYDQDYFDTAYDGLYKNLDDFLDIDRAESEIKAATEKKTVIDEMQRDITSLETEQKLIDDFKFKKEITDPGLKRAIEERAATQQRQIKELKTKLDIAVKEKLVIPGVKIDLNRTTESPVEKGQEIVPSEKSLTETIKETKSRKSAEERVRKAQEELSKIKAGDKTSAFPGITPKTTVTTLSGRTVKTSTEHIGAMTPQQAQRLYGDQFQITVSSTPYRINTDGTITRLEPIIRTSTWLSPADAIREAQQLQTEPQTSLESAVQQATAVATALQTGVLPQVSPQVKTETITATQLAVETAPEMITEVKPPVVTPVIIPPPVKLPTTGKVITGLTRLQTNSPMSQPVEQGSLAWVQGSLKGVRGVETARWWYKPPPYDKEPIPLSAPPTGAKWDGSLDPHDTIQIIGTSRAAVPNRVYAKLGFENITIINGREIGFDKAAIDGTNSKMVDLNLDSVPEFAINKPVNRTEFGSKAKRIGKNKAADKGNNYVSLRGVRR